MIITATIIAGCLYSFRQELKEREESRIHNLFQKLPIPSALDQSKGLSIKDQLTEVLTPFNNDIRAQHRKVLS